MFIYSVRGATVKFFGIIALSLAALIILIALIPSSDNAVTTVAMSDGSTINYDKIKTKEDRMSFISQFGWEADASSEVSEEVTVPSDFDSVFIGYNDIQKQQGLDLGKYKRKKLVRYTYTVSNYPDYTDTVYINLLVYRDRVVGGDVCSADVNGFVHGFVK